VRTQVFRRISIAGYGSDTSDKCDGSGTRQDKVLLPLAEKLSSDVLYNRHWLNLINTCLKMHSEAHKEKSLFWEEAQKSLFETIRTFRNQ